MSVNKKRRPPPRPIGANIKTYYVFHESQRETVAVIWEKSGWDHEISCSKQRPPGTPWSNCTARHGVGKPGRKTTNQAWGHRLVNSEHGTFMRKREKANEKTQWLTREGGSGPKRDHQEPREPGRGRNASDTPGSENDRGGINTERGNHGQAPILNEAAQGSGTYRSKHDWRNYSSREWKIR